MQIHQNVKVLSIFYSLCNFRFYSVVMAVYVANITHSFALAASIFAATQIAQAVFEVPTGIFSDMVGRRKSVIIGAILSLISVVLYAIGQHYLIVLIGAILEGAWRAFFSGNNDALLYDSLATTQDTAQYHTQLGNIHSNLEFAGFVSAIVGGMIAAYSFPLLMWISVIPQVWSVLIALRLQDIPHRQKSSGNIFLHLHMALQEFRHNATLRTLSLANMISFGIGESVWSLQAVFYKTVLPIWAVGWVMALNFLFSTIGFRLSGKILNRWKPLTVLLYQEVHSRVLNGIALLFPSVLSPFLIASGAAVYGPGEVAKNTLFQSHYTDAQRATMASLNSLVGSIVFAISAVVIGMAADSWGPARALLLAQVCLISVGILYLRAGRLTASTHTK